MKQIWQFTNTSSVNFANTTTQVGANTLKLAMQILNWPFLSLQNSLDIVIVIVKIFTNLKYNFFYKFKV